MVEGKKIAPKSTPAVAKVGTESPQARRARAEFISAALSMSWQLAVIVLLPVVGGYKLDQHLHSLPLWTIVGFVVAMTGVFLLIKKTLQEFDPGRKDV